MEITRPFARLDLLLGRRVPEADGPSGCANLPGLRTFINAVAGLVFVVGFPAVLFVDAAVRYGRDGDAWVNSARSARLRESLADATSALVVGEVSRDASLAAVDRVFVRAGIDNVLTPQWFDDTIRSVHAAAATSAAGAARTAAVNLEGFKSALEVRLGLIGDRAGDTCRQLYGADPCADQGRAQQLIEHYRLRAQRAIGRIPDRLLLWRDTGGVNLRTLGAIRWLALALVLASALTLGLVNRRRPAALGAILAGGAGLFLAGVLVLRLIASGTGGAPSARARRHRRARRPAGRHRRPRPARLHLRDCRRCHARRHHRGLRAGRGRPGPRGPVACAEPARARRSQVSGPRDRHR